MNSKRIRVSAFKFLVLGGLMLLAVSANAQQAPLYRGSFTLPYEVRWGGTVLEPGDYTIVLDSAEAHGQLIIRGKNGAMALAPRAIARRAPAGPSSLLVKRDAGRRTLEAIHLAEIDVVLSYGRWGMQDVVLDPENVERIPILSIPQGACPEYCIG